MKKHRKRLYYSYLKPVKGIYMPVDDKKHKNTMKNSVVNTFLMRPSVITFYHSALGVFSSKKGVKIQYEFNSSHAERPARTDRFLG